MKAAAIFAGILLAGLAEFAAFVLAALGHGWIAPLYVSLILFVAYPVALVRSVDAIGADASAATADWVMLLVALAADLLLVAATYLGEGERFRMVAEFGRFWLIVWLILWLLWQLLTVATILRRNRTRNAAAGWS